MAIVMPDANLLTKAGFLLRAPLGSDEPTLDYDSTAANIAGGVYVDDWPAAWIPLGRTTSGTKIDDNGTVSSVESAEDYVPLWQGTTKREPQVSFELMNITARNLSDALNGAVLTTTGTADTSASRVSAPDPMNEVFCMIGWESDDSTVRWVGRMCLNSGNLSVALAKAPSTATIPWTAVLAKPAGLPAYDWGFAGTGRA